MSVPMTRLSVVCLLFLSPALAIASPGLAPAAPLESQAAAIPSNESSTVDKEPEKLVCRAEKKIGSNRPERVCRTKAELDRQREHAEGQMRRPQNGG